MERIQRRAEDAGKGHDEMRGREEEARHRQLNGCLRAMLMDSEEEEEMQSSLGGRRWEKNAKEKQKKCDERKGKCAYKSVNDARTGRRFSKTNAMQRAKKTKQWTGKQLLMQEEENNAMLRTEGWMRGTSRKENAMKRREKHHVMVVEPERGRKGRGIRHRCIQWMNADLQLLTSRRENVSWSLSRS